MKITLAEIKSLEESLAKIFNKEVNIRTAYRLSKLLVKFSEEMKILEDNRIKLVRQYGVEDEKTKQITVPPEKTQEFYKELTSLMQLEIDIDFKPIKLKDFGNIELSASDVMKLDGKIIMGEEPKKAAKKDNKKKDTKNKKAIVI